MSRARQITVALLTVALASPVGAIGPDSVSLPFARPARPFLLVDPEHRFVRGAPASIRVQLRGGAPVRIALFRLDDPEPWTRLPVAPDGLAIAATPTGQACERLLRAPGALPRRDGAVTLLRDDRVTLAAPAPVRRTGGDESAVYDSSDADEGAVETRWVRAGRWRDQRVDLGVLPEGLYLARVHAGAWAASTLVSVSDLTLLVRRGDRRETVVAATADGLPLAGVAVTADDGSARARTDARGEAQFDPADAGTRRFVAHRGGQWAWADAAHARLDACDVRVYLDPGRPVFRRGEVLHLRGHARGCLNGRDAPLARESVTVQDHDAPAPTPGTTVLTDADGNFVTELTVATTELRALVRGRSHVRTIVLDDRALPARALVVSADRAFAAAGETVRVRASDDAGRWPTAATVRFEFMGQVREATVGPDHAAEVTFTVGPRDDDARREVIHASLAHDGRITTAEAEVWTGRHPVLLHVEGSAAVGTPGGVTVVRVRAENLGGERLREGVALRVTGSDGNRAVGPVRWSGRVETTIAGDARAEVRLPGAGPWWVTAADERGLAAEGGTVVWERVRPPSLGSGGALAVRPASAEVIAGGTLPVDLSRPARGATWVTLEQSGVWASAWVPAGAPAGGAAWWRTVLGLPVDAQGVASVVATHLAQGSVETATAVVGVTAAPALALAVTSDARSYAEGATMHATLTARSPDGAPRDAVVSLWLADEGYWNLSPEAYPPVDAMLSLPGRPASGADSARPRAWGADEGRHLDPVALWNTLPLPDVTRYDAWNAGGDLVDVTARGRLDAVATALARAAGLTAAFVCPDRLTAAGTVSLEARDVPWDLLAVRIATRTDTYAWVSDRTLRLDCAPGPASNSSGSGFGSGSGSGYGGGGLGRSAREQRLEGDLFFVGARALGPDGRLDVDVPLPAHPGRWRLQALAIDAHGRGDRAYTVVSTTRPLTASVDAPTVLRPGDRATAAVTVHAPALAGQRAALSLEADGVTLEGLPDAVTLDARGDGRATFTVRADRPGAATLVGRASVGAAHDAVRAGVTVRDDDAVLPMSLHFTVDGRATDVDVPLPALTRRTELTVDADPRLGELADEVVAALAAPRWSAPSILVERLAALETLTGIGAEIPRVDGESRLARIAAAKESLEAELAAMRGLDGAVGWWRGGASSGFVTATMLFALGDHRRAPAWADAWAFVRERAATATGAEAARLVEALAWSPTASDAVLARAVLARLAADPTLSLDATRDAYVSARRVAPSTAATWLGRLRAGLTAALAGEARAECGGVAWFLCFAREGGRAEVARAAVVLPASDPATEALRDRAVSWLTARPAPTTAWWWGTSEADVLTLLAASLRGRPESATAFVVSVDGREVARGDRTHPVQVPIGTTASALRVSFARSDGRFARVHVAGSMALAPVGAPVGAVPFERRIDTGADGPTLTLRWTLPRAATGVELVVPLPAGLELARPSASRARVRATARDVGWWSALDQPPGSLRPLVERRDGALHLRMERLGAGAHTLSLPLVASASGRFSAGGAWLRTDDPAQWAMTPPVSFERP